MRLINTVKSATTRIRNNIILNRISKKGTIQQDLIVNTASSLRNQGSKENVIIGKHCVFFGIIQALCGGKVSIGDNTYVGTKSYIMSKNNVEIGNCCIIANDVIICDNNNHPVDPEARMEMSLCDDYLTDKKWTWEYADSSPIIIKDNTWIGRRSMIMKGVTIGEGSIVGAGAVVTHDVPPYTIVAGNPAKVVKHLR